MLLMHELDKPELSEDELEKALIEIEKLKEKHAIKTIQPRFVYFVNNGLFLKKKFKKEQNDG